MKLIKRYYLPGDELNINNLYKSITGIDRSIEEYHWEWIDTWKGKGNIWLAFDGDRAEGDKLIMQYSIIPTPFSFWGKPLLAGKTENCMSHIDCRGTGIYFPHEKEGFEEAKQRFQLFFTTAGSAGKGAAGAVRRKLGYIPFDSWVEYFHITRTNYAKKLIFDKLSQNKRLPKLATTMISSVAEIFTKIVFRLKSNRYADPDIRLFDTEESPIDKIEELWHKNKDFYGITVDRITPYMNWRINQNPYFNHHYLCYFDDDSLVGYIIFNHTQNDSIRIVDILADKKKNHIFNKLLSEILLHAQTEKVGAVVCSTLTGNKLLRSVLRKNHFLCREAFTLNSSLRTKNDQNHFLIYLSEKLDNHQKANDTSAWYITDLVKEGR